MTTFREKVAAEWKKYQAAEAARLAKEAAHLEKQTSAAFAKHWGSQPETVSGSVALVDGIRLNYNPRTTEWTVFGNCPNCGEICRSYPVFTLYQVGRELEKFEPDTSLHTCGAPSPEEGAF